MAEGYRALSPSMPIGRRYLIFGPWVFTTGGTTAEQDNRFKDKTAKLLRTMKFPEIFEKKVMLLSSSALGSVFSRSMWASGRYEESGIISHETLDRPKDQYTAWV